MNRLMALYARNRGAGAGLRVSAAAADDEATLYVYDTIVATEADAEWFGGVSADAFVRAVRGLSVGTLNVRINSPGGDVFAGRAMERALRDSGARVVVHVDGVAASAASVIAMAGDEVLMPRGSMLMIHRAWTVGWGNANDLLNTAALLEKIDGQLAETYAARTGGTPDDMLALMDAETWFTGAEAVEQGFATALVEDAPTAKAAWDLSVYAHAPKQPAPQRAPDRLMALAKLRAIQGRN